MITNDTIQTVSVKVNNGSGVLITLTTGLFVLTAKHCLDEKNNIESYNNDISFKQEEIYPHQSEDLALIKIIDFPEGINSVEISHAVDIDQNVKSYGFPSKGDKDGMPLLGKVSKWHETKSIKTDDALIGSNTGDVEAKVNIEGWSGSGLFKVDNQKLYLIGILVSLTDKEHTYKTIHCIPIDMCYELIKENDLGEFQTGVNKDSKVVLFTNYREECEEYYCERDEDKDFIKHLDVNNIWIFGKSGKGKTTLINRNLLYNKIEYLFCDMSPITIKSENDVLEDILSTIEDKFDITRDPNQKNIIKSIVSLLNSLKNKQIVIVIDEMSIADQTVLKEVASSFLMLVTHYVNKREDRNLKFVVSTISEPKDLLINAAKATDYFQYICCDNWDDHMNKLFDSLVSVLELYVVKEDRSFIIKESNKSPRVLKNILRKMVVCEDLNSTKIKEIVQRTLEESL